MKRTHRIAPSLLSADFARLGRKVSRATPLVPRLLAGVAHWMPNSVRRAMLRLPGVARLQRRMAEGHDPSRNETGGGSTNRDA